MRNRLFLVKITCNTQLLLGTGQMEQFENGPALWLAGGGRASSQPALAPAFLSPSCPGARSSGAEALTNESARLESWDRDSAPPSRAPQRDAGSSRPCAHSSASASCLRSNRIPGSAPQLSQRIPRGSRPAAPGAPRGSPSARPQPTPGAGSPLFSGARLHQTRGGVRVGAVRPGGKAPARAGPPGFHQNAFGLAPASTRPENTDALAHGRLWL